MKTKKGDVSMRVDFNKVQDVLENYKSAVYEKDVERFVSTYASDIHVYDCWENWECIGISKWKKMVEGWFNGLSEEGVLLKTDFDDLVVEENSNLAFVHCAVSFTAYNESGEKLRQMTNRFTFGLRKENESWTITHEHSSLPISMETGKGIFNLK
jgi:ketosteroid isomerase-like protein